MPFLKDYGGMENAMFSGASGGGIFSGASSGGLFSGASGGGMENTVLNTILNLDASTIKDKV